jgi:putative sterol carrier protein
MKSPARRAVLDGIFWQMPRQLDAKAAANVKTAIRWNITGRADNGVDTYLLEVDRGTARTNRGTEGPEPKLTITMDGVEFLRLISGNSDPMAAYFKGRIQLAGDIMVAAQLAQIFKMPTGSEGSSDEGGTGDNGFTNGGGELDDPSSH